jgi:Putative auto-transporter adhesin, head GIN domain
MSRHRPRSILACTLSTTLLAVFVGVMALPQASQAGTEVRPVEVFTGISLRSSAHLRVTQGSPVSVQVQGDDEVLPLLETVVDKGRLEVRWKRGEPGMRRQAQPLVVTVVVPELTALSVAGSGDAEVSAFTTPRLQVAVAGSGSARLDRLSTDELNLSIAGSGDVRANGRAGTLGISIAGSGNVGLAGLQAEDVSLRIAGSGDAEVHANKTLKISIAGSGDVVYSGDAVVTRSVMGSGSVKKR